MPKYPKFKQKTIKYNSPSGRVNVGKYVPPFEKVEEGYGYKGVVLEDIGTGKLQCHICGGWYEIFNSHLKTKHNITSNEYREMFGLSRSTALKSKRVRVRQSKVMKDMRKKHSKHRYVFPKNNKQAGNRKKKPKSQETINKYGVCDLQIADKIIKLKNKLGRTPTLIEISDEYGGTIMYHIHKRYKGYIKLCRNLGFELNFSNRNPKYSKQYFLEKGLSNEAHTRVLNQSELRAIYKYFNSIKEWREEVEKHRK